MSYVALYRKYRPDNFDEVKGQDHIVTTLRNQVSHDRVGHAYLFCGTRGTGKTTVAKILAKAVNCEHPVNGSPCGECASCRAIQEGRAMNVIEIDAASNNGVDNIRDITEAVQYAPSDGKKLCYIIDEVHMLSQGAYNALLKTLEEPPEYVLFILATTEDYKVPVTIRSRCQRYDFHRISVETISGRLKDLLDREEVTATEDALSYIARAADGSMRDSLSILDECVSSNLGKTLDKESVLKTVGAVDTDTYVDLINAIKADDAEKVLSTVNDIVWQGRDLVKFVDDFVWFVRNMLFLKLSPGIKNSLDMTAEAADATIALGEQFSRETLTRFLELLQTLSGEIRFASVKRVALEMSLIKMMHPEMQQNYESIVNRVENLERDLDRKVEELATKGISVANVAPAQANVNAASPAPALTPAQQSAKVVDNLKKKFAPAEVEDIVKLAENLKKKVYPTLNKFEYDCITQSELEPAGDYSSEGPAKLKIICKVPAGVEPSITQNYFKDDDNRHRFEEEVSDLIERQVVIEYEMRTVAGGAPSNDDMFNLSKINMQVELMD